MILNLLLTKTEGKHRIILFTFVVFVMGISFAYFVYMPQQEQIAVLTMEKQRGAAALAQAEKFLNDHPDFAVYEREILGKRRFLDLKLPDTLELSAFLAQIEESAVLSRVRLVKVNPGERVSLAAYDEARVFVGVRGGYAEVLDFLKRLEQSVRFHTIDAVKIWSAQGEINGDFGIRIYSHHASANQRELNGSASNSEKE